MFKNYHESFNFFDGAKYKTNEYFLKGKRLGLDIKRTSTLHTNTINAEKLTNDIKVYENCTTQIVNDVAVERFSPDNINNKDFWVEARNKFPLLSVCGSPCKSIKEANTTTLTMPKHFKFIEFLDTLIDDSEEKLNVLEIGFGYGGMFSKLRKRCEYIGIDYIIPQHLKRYSNFIELDVSGVPDYLLNQNYFDVVYAVNVLQHCSQKERFKYFRQAQNILKKGGHMFFSMNLTTRKNKDIHKYWALKDDRGRNYTHFFNQLTEVDFEDEFLDILRELDFKIISGNIMQMCLGMIIQK